MYTFILGSLPSRNNGSVAMTTCLQTEKDICEMTFNINITNCGGYYVYYMVKTPANSSYCVGKFTIEIFRSSYCLHCQSNMLKSVLHIYLIGLVIVYGCLMTVSTICQLHRGSNYVGGGHYSTWRNNRHAKCSDNLKVNWVHRPWLWINHRRSVHS